MTNEITVNIEELLTLPDNSIDDGESIRQIGLITCSNNNLTKEIRNKLVDKIKRGYEVYGLYPHVINSCDPSDYSGGLCKYQKEFDDGQQLISDMLRDSLLPLRKLNKIS